MKVLYDHQIFSRQKYGGISRYFCEIIKYYIAAGDPTVEVAIKYPKNMYFRSVDKGHTHVNRPWGLDCLLSKPKKINQRVSQRVLRKGDYDLFHPTYHRPYFLKCLKNKPFVLTIHDLIHEVFQDTYGGAKKAIECKKSLIKRADHIIVISLNTKKDLLKYYGVPENKVSVIYDATSLGDLSAETPSDSIPKRYVLFVGGRRSSKNFQVFLKATVPLLREDEGLRIVCAGGRNFSEQELALLQSLRVSDRILHVLPSDGQMAWLYRHALTLVYPSLYEGFGLPVLEAFSCDCPAIISRRSSLPEVGGDAAEYIDPESEDSIRSAVQRVIYSQELRESLIAKGRLQNENFSWGKTAEQTHSVYKQLV
ncbi:MAG: glycosyltransferase family 4 protein [Phycisphaeraceae bacterium]|nr:glycosyltransferase family 4 protein [Phycisphaeraceae bacterium]